VPIDKGRAEFMLECPCGPVAVHATDGGPHVAFDSGSLGPHRAWRVRLAGTASFHGTAIWTVEDGDPLSDGFVIDDAMPLPPL
jgi:hypothetical protein